MSMRNTNLHESHESSRRVLGEDPCDWCKFVFSPLLGCNDETLNQVGLCASVPLWLPLMSLGISSLIGHCSLVIGHFSILRYISPMRNAGRLAVVVAVMGLWLAAAAPRVIAAAPADADAPDTVSPAAVLQPPRGADDPERIFGGMPMPRDF